MRDLYVYNSTAAWKKYHAEKKKGFPYSKSAAFQLNSGISWDGQCEHDKLREPSAAFLPYWMGIELIHEGKENALKLTIPELLAKCKKDYEKRLERAKQWERKPDTYNGYPLNWRMYRPLAHDDADNSYDITTFVCELPFKATKEQKEELRQLIWEPFYDPYCDGRQTGKWSTSSVGIYTTNNKTVICHIRHCDC